FTTFFADQDRYHHVRIEGTIAARRAHSFDYVVEWAPGIEPDPESWMRVQGEQNVTAPMSATLGDIDVTNVMVANAGEVENRYTITVRVRATAHYDAPIGNVTGEARRVVYVARDASLLPGFPIDTGGASVE